MRWLLERNANAVTEGLLAATRFDTSAQIRALGLVTRIEGFAISIDRFAKANGEDFENIPAGALLNRAAREAREAAAELGSLLDRTERLRLPPSPSLPSA